MSGNSKRSMVLSISSKIDDDDNDEELHNNEIVLSNNVAQANHNRRNFNFKVNLKDIPAAHIFTIHGFQHITNASNNRWYRLAWLLVFLTLGLLGSYWSVSTYVHWANHRTLTGIKTTALPITQIDFPSITICRTGHLPMKTIIKQQFQTYVQKMDPSYNASADVDAYWIRNFTDTLYPGLGNATDLEIVADMMLDDNPGNLMKSLVLTNGGYDPSVFGNVDACPKGWTSIGTDACIFNAGSGIFDNDPCPAMGGHLTRELTIKQLDQIKDNLGTIPLPLDIYFWMDFLYNQTTNNFTLYGNNIPLSNLNANMTGQVMMVPEIGTSGECIKAKIDFKLHILSYKRTQCNDQAIFLCQMEILTCNLTYQVDIDDSFSDEKYDKAVALLFDPINAKDLKSYTSLAIKNIKNKFNSMDKARSIDALFNMMWQSQLDCFGRDDSSMIRECTWKNQPVPCSSVFNKTPTDRGVCCSFNIHVAEMLHESAFRQRVIKQQVNDFSNNGSMSDLGWTSKIVPNTGRKNGLSFILDGSFDSLAPSSVDENVVGFTAIVDGRNQFPMTETNRKISLMPGHENLVSLSAFKVTTDDSIRGLDPIDRQCYFESEVSLYAHKHYTQSNCFLECLLNHTMIQMSPRQCQPWNFPPVSNQGDLPFCDPWETEQFHFILANVSIEDHCLICLPECEETQYTASVTSAPFRQPCDYTNIGRTTFCDLNLTPGNDFSIWGKRVTDKYKYVLPKDVQDDLEKTDKDGHNPYNGDITHVFIFFESPTIIEYSRETRLTLLELIGQIGGLMGLCVGLSFVSVLELIYFAVYKTGRMGFAFWSKDRVFQITIRDFD